MLLFSIYALKLGSGNFPRKVHSVHIKTLREGIADGRLRNQIAQLVAIVRRRTFVVLMVSRDCDKYRFLRHDGYRRVPRSSAEVGSITISAYWHNQAACDQGSELQIEIRAGNKIRCRFRTGANEPAATTEHDGQRDKRGTSGPAGRLPRSIGQSAGKKIELLLHCE